MVNLDDVVQDRLVKIAQEEKLRILPLCLFEDKNHMVFEGKKLISFATNDYFGLSNDERVKEAAINAIKIYGVGGKSARLICGNYNLYQQLEENLAQYKKTEKAVVFGSGYLAAIGVIPAIIGRKDLVVADKLIHASLLDGIKLSGATLKRYHHNDYTHCANILRAERHKYQNCLLISETIFSMDGDLGDVKKLLLLAENNDSWLLTDDAHGFAIIDYVGSNYAKHNYIQLGTLSKGIGGYGGYVAASKNICDYIITKTRSFIYTTALPYPVVAAADRAITLLRNDHIIIARLKQNIELFAEQMGLESQISPIFTIEFDSIKKLNDVHQSLIKHGFYVGRIRPPTSSTPRLRISLSASHQITEIKKLCQAIKKIIRLP